MARSMHGEATVLCRTEDNSVGVKIYENKSLCLWVNGKGHMHLSQMWNSRTGGGNIMLTPMHVTSHEGAKIAGRPHADSVVVAEALHTPVGVVKIRAYNDGCYRLAFSKSDHYYAIGGFWFDDNGGNVVLSLGNVSIPVSEEDEPKTREYRWEVPVDEWDSYRETINERLVANASAGAVVSYTDLIVGLEHLTDPHSHALAEMLGEIQDRCHKNGSPLLPAIVTYKHDPTNPSKGFFDKAKSLGYEVGSSKAQQDAFWIKQMGAAFAAYRSVTTP